MLFFFNDILIYSPDWSIHLQHLWLVFHLLLDNHLFVKQSKCKFVIEAVKYLDHVIFNERVSFDQKKIESIFDWPTPNTVKALRRFIGLTRFYRRFVWGYAKVIAPLTALLCKDLFAWAKEAQIALVDLKKIMTTTPVLSLPNFDLPFIVEIDASEHSHGCHIAVGESPHLIL